MHRLLERQTELHSEATLLLQETLIPTLKKYGKVIVGGSYNYELLYHPDIDIDVVTNIASKAMFADITRDIIGLSNTSKFKGTDRVNFPHTHSGGRPVGFWLGSEIHFGSNIWKLDIWLQKPEWHTGQTNQYASELLNLDDDTRLTILNLKEELLNANLYGVGKEFTSVDLYEGVLRGKISTIDELRTFMANQPPKILGS
jgi:hypothetical protein